MITSDSDETAFDADFRTRAPFWVGISAFVLVAPFALKAFLDTRPLLGAILLAIVALLSAGAWLTHRGLYRSIMAFVTVTPLVTGGIVYALLDQGVSALFWTYPAVLSFYCMLSEHHARLANLVLLALVLPLAQHALDYDIALRAIVTLCGVSVFTAILVNVIGSQQTRLHHKVVTDPLTGLLNRHALGPALEHAVAQARAEGTSMTVLTLDLDHFKRVNDEHGHAAGDEVLRSLGALLSDRARAGDSVFRLGGEEFLVLLRGAGAAHAGRLAEGFRRAVGDAELLAGHPLTASIGVASLAAGESWETWINRADSALYRAKAGGRDRVAGDESHDA